ncbi:hypothetical protein GCM10008986_25370 [Salinibacillus aidingensis]|uniref:Uncharacterized protein n=1 Tax=Salinibacillus aidingensis TaxID=237684 RepID=A0ABP3LBK4_9BACI
MKANSMIFIIGFVLAFAGGYLLFGSSNAAEETVDPAPAEDTTAYIFGKSCLTPL